MENEHIFIDGIDVSGCECFYINDSHPERKECINPYCKGLCKDNPNCYYKQLQRSEAQCEGMFVLHTDLEKKYKTKEKECEIWKNQVLTIDDEAVTVQITQQQFEEYNQLKVENEELKRQYKELGQCSKRLKDYYNKEKETLSNRFLRLKQTLAEIKEIAKNMNKECFYDDFDCKDCDMQNGCTYFNKKQILQKISECEVEDD